MSTNLKHFPQKKLSLNTKVLPLKTFRPKLEKTKQSQQPLVQINENDINQGNLKTKNVKESQAKKNKITDK